MSCTHRPLRLQRAKRLPRVIHVALSDIDRNLLDRCLNNKPRAWEDFVDRFMGLVVHVINHTAQCRSIRLSASDREDLAAEVFLAIVDQNGIAAAAERLGLTSSAVSQLLAELERELGFRLFDRTTRRVSLSTAGRDFLSSAESVLRKLSCRPSWTATTV